MTYLLLGLGAAVVAMYLVAGRRLAKRDLRIVATIDIPASGQPSVSLEPPNPAQEDLVRLLLVYGTKLRWLMTHEPTEIQELLKHLIGEAIDVWHVGEGSLMPRMPTVTTILAAKDISFAVPVGERFVVKYSRTRYNKLRNRSSIYNTLPRPGLAANIAWNYILLLDAVHGKLDTAHQDLAYASLLTWWEAVFSPNMPRNLTALGALIGVADQIVDHGILGASDEENVNA